MRVTDWEISSEDSALDVILTDRDSMASLASSSFSRNGIKCALKFKVVIIDLLKKMCFVRTCSGHNGVGLTDNADNTERI